MGTQQRTCKLTYLSSGRRSPRRHLRHRFANTSQVIVLDKYMTRKSAQGDGADPAAC
jgi:hypothetical protein